MGKSQLAVKRSSVRLRYTPQKIADFLFRMHYFLSIYEVVHSAFEIHVIPGRTIPEMFSLYVVLFSYFI